MLAPFELLGSLGVAKILYLSAALTSAQATVSWSPDSRWICYTVAEPRTQVDTASEWLFKSSDFEASSKSPEVAASRTGREPGRFRIWATQVGSTSASALLEESDGPLGAPSWRPDGRAVAFARIVPQGSDGDRVRGRFEVVVMDGLDRRKVIHAEDALEFEGTGVGEFLASPPSWNRDGSFLAVTCPVGAGKVLVLDSRTGALARTVDNASKPVWSPNGSRLAVVRPDTRNESRDALLLIDTPVSTSMSHVRTLASEEKILQPPQWSADGLSIFVVYRRTRASGTRQPLLEIILGQVSGLTGNKSQEWPLVSQRSLNEGRSSRIVPHGAETRFRTDVERPPSNLAAAFGCRLDIHPETEECFYTTEHMGLSSVVVCQNLRNEITHKRFPPLDQTIGVAALAVSPDGNTLAVRFRSSMDPNLISSPALCDIATETLTIPTADESSRIEWLSELIHTTEALLKAAIPPAMVPGIGAGHRPILLPAPGELNHGHPLAPRIHRIARIGRTLCDPVPHSDGEVGSAHDHVFLTQARLYFEYLAGNLDAAETAIGDLEALPLSPRRRSALLGVRAQILMSKGDLQGSLAIIKYLSDQEPAWMSMVEETPIGIKIKSVPNPSRLWGEYLALRLDDIKKSPSELPPPGSDEMKMIPPRPREFLEEINREPLKVPFIPFNPDARLFIEPPVFVRP